MNYKRRVWLDVEDGEAKELAVREELMKKLHLNKLEKTGKYDCFDFRSERGFVEYRTRNCYANQYPTTILPIAKIKFANSVEEECIIVIQFKDKMMYWVVPKDYQCEAEVGGRNDRGKNEYKKKYIYLDVCHLREF